MGDSGAIVPIVRRLPFVELMELLEFDRLRLDPPVRASGAEARREVIGTQEWLRPEVTPAADARESDVYICSTLKALRESILPPDGALLHFDLAGSAVPRPERFSIDRVRIRMVGSARARRWQPRLRVDLRALIQKVWVPATSAPDLFELVQRVVSSRIWVDVIRGDDIAVPAGSTPALEENYECQR